MSGELTLGGVVFRDFASPGKLEGFGGKHSLAIKKLLGGQRVIDALGPDDAEIHWTGRFRGPQALASATLIDAMRAAGQPVQLSAIGLVRIVIIAEFLFSPEKPYEVPYSITCVVAQNPMFGNLTAAPSSLDTLVDNDMTSINSISATGGSPIVVPQNALGFGIGGV